MRALQLVKPRKFQQVEVATPKLPGEEKDLILVKNNWAALCGSDVPFYKGTKPWVTYPLLPGARVHECIGEVIESQSSNFQPGDYVLAMPENDQGWAEYYIARDSKTLKLPAEVAKRGVSCIIQPLSTVLYAVDRLDLQGNPTVVILGLGFMGLSFCWLLKKRGVEQIVGIDPIAERCSFAEKLGVTRTICSRSQDVVQHVESDVQYMEPPDICIEAVGHQTETINDAIALIRRQGTVLAFGVPDQDMYTINYERFFRKNAHIIASVTPDWRIYLPKARDLYDQHTAELEPFVTHSFPIKDIQRAFTLTERYEDGIVKGIVDINSW